MECADERQGRYVGARQLVVRYGAQTVLSAVLDMTYFDEVKCARCWVGSIVSPARYLNWYVRQLAEVARREWEASW